MAAHVPITTNDLPEGQEFRCSSEVWKRFSFERGALLVVGHGTRNPEGASQLLDLASQMQSRAPEVIISSCFLELAEPTIDQAIQSLFQQGIQKLLVIPILLFTAAHAREDIPDAVRESASRLNMQVIGQTGSLGTHPAVISLSATRYQEVLALELGQCCPLKSCARVQCSSGSCEASGKRIGRVGLAMVGRGTSDATALAQMRQFTERRVAQTQLAHCETGFFAGGTPTVDALLDNAAHWDCDTVVVQPHLLFEGDLVNQLRQKVFDRQHSHPDRNWMIARTLGADPKLADVFLSLALEEILKSA
jgi:sirohydrochlorin cobaltochelatase